MIRTVRATIDIRLDESERFKHNGPTGAMLVKQIDAWYSETAVALKSEQFDYLARPVEVRVRGHMIRKDGTLGFLFREDMFFPFENLPEEIRAKFPAYIRV